MQQQMTIGKKLAFTSGWLFAGTVLVGVVSIYNLAGLNGTTQQIITDPLPGMARIATARAAALTARGDVWRHISEPNPASMAEIERSVQENRSMSAQALRDYEPTITTAEARALYDRLKPAMQKYLDELSGVLELSRAGKSRDARLRYDAEAQPAYNATMELMQSEIRLKRTNGEKLAAESQQTYAKAFWALVFTLAFCCLGGAGAAFVVIRSLNRALRQAVTELAEGAGQVASAASQVSSSSQALAQGSSEQAASLQETPASR